MGDQSADCFDSGIPRRVVFRRASSSSVWQTFGGAVRYILHVPRLDGAGVVIREDFLAATNYINPTPLVAGNYRWWVQAVNAAGDFSFWTLPSEFTISLQRDMQ